MRSLLGRPADPSAAPPPPMPPAAKPSGWEGMGGTTKLVLLGSAAVAIVGFVIMPGFSKKPAPPPTRTEDIRPARIMETDPPAAPDILVRVTSNTGAGIAPSAAPGEPRRRRRPAVTEMALYAPAVTAPTAAPVASSAARGASGLGEGAGEADGPSGGLPGGVGGGQASPLTASVSGATRLATSHASLVRNPDFLIRAGDKIPCLPVDAMNSSRAGFTTCTVPEWYRSTNQRRGLIPPGTRIFGQIRSGLANGETRLGVLYTEIQTPLFNMPLAAPAADEMGRSGVDGDVHTFFWDKLGGVALYALMDVSVGAGQNVASSALSNAFGNGGTTLNLGSQAQTLASQQFQATNNRPPVLTRDQALPLTVSVGQDLDFSEACKLALQADPMACPVL